MRLRAAIAACAAAGIGIASYLLAVRLAHVPLACATGGCETVQSSRYAELAGVPVAALGLAAYAAVLASALARGAVAAAAGVAVSVSGVAFGGYLLYVQLAVVDALCAWCVASDATMTVLAALCLLRLRTFPQPARGPARMPADPGADTVRL
jgi:uncharacterized membrane protein